MNNTIDPIRFQKQLNKIADQIRLLDHKIARCERIVGYDRQDHPQVISVGDSVKIQIDIPIFPPHPAESIKGKVGIVSFINNDDDIIHVLGRFTGKEELTEVVVKVDDVSRVFPYPFLDRDQRKPVKEFNANLTDDIPAEYAEEYIKHVELDFYKNASPELIHRYVQETYGDANAYHSHNGDCIYYHLYHKLRSKIEIPEAYEDK